MRPPARTITYSEVVHLSHIIGPGMPCWPGDPPLALDTVADRATDGYYLRRLTIGEHSATHLNAPASFHAGGLTVDGYAAAALVVPAVVLDARAAATVDADFLASERDLAAWETSHGLVPEGSIVLLNSGWSARWRDPRAFFNRGSDGAMHFPGFSPTLAEILVERRGVAGFGIDTHGVDGGRDTRFAVNARALDRPRLVLENLTNLDRLPPAGTTLVVGILRLYDGSGSPASVLAFVP